MENIVEKILIGAGMLALGYLATQGTGKAKNTPTIYWPPVGETDTPTIYWPPVDMPTVKPETSNEAYKTFVSKKYEIQFDYPSDWVKNPRYEDKYEGATGFFEVGDFTEENNSIESAVVDQINAPYQPYGNNPNVQYTTLDGQPAAIIYSSSDQNDFYNDRDCAIIVRYPTPNDVNGTLYNFVDIWTTPDYVPVIMKTFKFVNIKKEA